DIPGRMPARIAWAEQNTTFGPRAAWRFTSTTVLPRSSGRSCRSRWSGHFGRYTHRSRLTVDLQNKGPPGYSASATHHLDPKLGKGTGRGNGTDQKSQRGRRGRTQGCRPP